MQAVKQILYMQADEKGFTCKQAKSLYMAADKKKSFTCKQKKKTEIKINKAISMRINIVKTIDQQTA